MENGGLPPVLTRMGVVWVSGEAAYSLPPRGTVNSPAKFASKFALGGIFACKNDG